MADKGIAGSITSSKGNGTGRGARKSKVEGGAPAEVESPKGGKQGGYIKPFEFAKGGSGADNTMFQRGKDGAGRANPAEPGTASPGTSGGGDWAKGGDGPNNHMFGVQAADKSVPGQTGKNPGIDAGRRVD